MSTLDPDIKAYRVTLNGEDSVDLTVYMDDHHFTFLSGLAEQLNEQNIPCAPSITIEEETSIL